MSEQLLIELPERLAAAVRRAAARERVSKAQWIQNALERVLIEAVRDPDPVAELATLDGPTGDLDQMLDEIEAGRQR